jgi:uncharacterized protein
VDLIDFRPEDVDIKDVAHSLANLCRFNGHCSRFYSVAQHSVVVSEIVSPEHSKHGLLHDAAEAYVGDLPTPVKKIVTGFISLEDRLLSTIFFAFGVDDRIPDDVREADLITLATEKRDLLKPEPSPWTGVDGVIPLRNTIVPWSPLEAELRFLERYHDLFDKEK